MTSGGAFIVLKPDATKSLFLLEVFKTRKSHKKSRGGCVNCRERRVKCCERRPVCLRCELRSLDCKWSRSERPQSADTIKSPTSDEGTSDRQNLSQDVRQKSVECASTRSTLDSAPPSLCTDSSPEAGCPAITPESESPVPYLNVPPSGDSDSRLSSPDLTHQQHGFNDLTSTSTEEALMEHFVEHTNRLVSQHLIAEHAYKFIMPIIARRNDTTKHAILGLSALCICVDLLEGSSHLVPNHIKATNSDNPFELLHVATSHYEQALMRLKEDLSKDDLVDMESILVTTILLIPLCFTKHRVERLLGQCFSTPAAGIWEPLVTCRGVKIVLQTIFPYVYQARECNTDTSQALAVDNISPAGAQYSKRSGPHSNLSLSPRLVATRPPGSQHPLFATISKTWWTAHTDLARRLGIHQEFTSSYDYDTQRQAACQEAYNVLLEIYQDLFVRPPHDAQDINPVPQNSFLAASVLCEWLQKSVLPRAKVVRGQSLVPIIICWISRIPSEYINIVQPFLQTDLDTDIMLPALDEVVLTALEIYRHWLVLTILMEHESWSIADTGLYELERVTKLMYDDDALARQGEDWPMRMCELGRQMSTS